MKRKVMLTLLFGLMLTLVGCSGCNNDGGEVASTPDAPVSGTAIPGSTSHTPTTPAGQGTTTTGDPHVIQGSGTDGILDLEIDLSPEENTDKAGTTTQASDNAGEPSTTAPTAGDFNDPNNFIEVPLG